MPSCWEQHGFGNYNYGRDYVTYGRNFRFADEKGMYKLRFTVPASWKNKEVFIVTIKRTLWFYFGLPAPEVQREQFTMPSVNDLF